MGDTQEEDRNQVYARAVPHKIAGYFQSFSTAATILRIARTELDASVCTSGTSTSPGDDALENFFQLLDTIEGSLSQRKQNTQTQPFVVAVEGLDGSGKSTLVTSLAQALGGIPCATPSTSVMAVRPAMDKRGGAVARAFYMVSNYALQHEIQSQGRHSVFVVDRWFSSTCAYSVAWKNTTGGPEAIDALPEHLFEWPKDLIPPQVQVLLHVDDDIRQRRVERREASEGIPASSRFNQWDQRLAEDVNLGQRICRAHQRSVGPHEKIVVSANGTPAEVLEAVLQLVLPRLERHQTPWKTFSHSPMQWFQWQASSSLQCPPLCHAETGRRLHHASWARHIALGSATDPKDVPPTLRSVEIHAANDQGILFYTWAPTSPFLNSMASMVCIMGDYPLEQQWRSEGILVETTFQTNQALGIDPPSMLEANIATCAQLTNNDTNPSSIGPQQHHRPLCPPDDSYEATLERMQQQQLPSPSSQMLSVATRFIPLRIEVLLGGPSSPGVSQRWEWTRGPYRCEDDSPVGTDPSGSCTTLTRSDDKGWSPARRILPFTPPQSISPVPPIQLQPLTIVMLGTHCAGKKTIGMRLAQLLNFEFHPELGDIMRGDVTHLLKDGHRQDYGSDWDDRIFEAERQRDEESSKGKKSRVVETWHVGNWAWSQSRSDPGVNSSTSTTLGQLQEQIQHAIQQAIGSSCVLFVLLAVDLDTSERRREMDPTNVARLPMSDAARECPRLYSYLQEKVQDIIPSTCPVLTVNNSHDGDDAIQKSCREILQFVLEQQWRRAVFKP